jgi:hypothetical protein
MDQPFSFSLSLMNLMNDGAGSAGGLLVLVGGVMACLAAAYRVVQGWPGQQSAALGLFGFAVFIAGVLAIAAQWGFDAGSEGTVFGFGYGLTIGFWVELAIGVAGVVICLFNLARPIHSPYVNPTQTYWQGGEQGPWRAPQTPQWQGQPGWSSAVTPFWPQQPGAAPYGFTGPTPLPPQGPTPSSAPGELASNDATGETSAPAGVRKGRLIVTSGATTSATDVPPGQTLIVGSDPTANIVIADYAASPRQLSVALTPTGWRIRALDFTHPAFLRDASGLIGMLLGEADVAAGELQIGSTRLILEPPTTA